MRKLVVITLLFGNLFAIGCAASRSQRPYPIDPLLLQKRPVETKAAEAAPPTLAQTDPTPPCLPEIAVAAAEAPTAPNEPEAKPLPTTSTPEFRTAERSPGAAPAQTVTTPENLPAPATTAVRSKETPTQAVPPAIRRQVPEKYGHAADYRWLQGVLEKRHQGLWELRYCDASREDKHGGKVVLTDDPRLAAFAAGDLILVEGELLADQATRGAWRHFPEFRIREVWLAQAQIDK